MCLEINSYYHNTHTGSDTPIALIAKRDLIAFKFIMPQPGWQHPGPTRYVTPFQRDVVMIGQMYTAAFGLDWQCASPIFPSPRWTVSEGLHAFTNLQKACLEDFVPVMVIIPKGTKYYIGCNDDVVAETLVYKKVLIDDQRPCPSSTRARWNESVDIYRYAYKQIKWLKLFHPRKFRVIPRA